MASATATVSAGTPRSPVADSRHDRRLAHVLAHATRIFCEKGYEGASLRDLSRSSGMSLAGLYHYFQSKEELLYLIQKHCFTTIQERLAARLDRARSPEQKLRVLIQNHLEFFLANQQAMKVLSHEDDALTGDYGREVRALKREYYRVCLELVEQLVLREHARRSVKSGVGKSEPGSSASPAQMTPRIAVLSLFGMMNWIYTWHQPKNDADARALARQMGDIFLNGILGSAKRSSSKTS